MVLLSWYMTRVVVKNFSTDGEGCNARTGRRFSDKLGESFSHGSRSRAFQRHFIGGAGFPCVCGLKWDAAGPSPLVLPAVATYTNHTGAETASSIAETCRTIPIALLPLFGGPTTLPAELSVAR